MTATFTSAHAADEPCKCAWVWFPSAEIMKRKLDLPGTFIPLFHIPTNENTEFATLTGRCESGVSLLSAISYPGVGRTSGIRDSKTLDTLYSSLEEPNRFWKILNRYVMQESYS